MAKGKTADTSGKSKYELALEELNKTYGKGSVITLGEKVEGDYSVISTGSLGFDTALGVGGLAKGRIMELIGWEGTGKSTICGHLSANCQNMGGRVLYIDAEHSVDLNYFRMLGVDTDKMMFAQPGYGEEGFDIAHKLISSGEIDLCILDSDSALLPKSVMEGDMGQSAIGKKAKLNSDAYPKLKAAVSKYNTAMVSISQFREKIGVMFGSPETTQGGHALKFYSDIRVEVRKSLAKEGEEVYGNKTKIKVIKNKLYPPHKTAEFDIVFGAGIDRNSEVLDFAIELNIIEKSGSWYSYKGDKIGQGVESVIQLLKDNPELGIEIEGLVLSKLKEVA